MKKVTSTIAAALAIAAFGTVIICGPGAPSASAASWSSAATP